jgi:8-oxo-dGTP pyrophosphatase MutT (NUDIX family)
MTKIIPIKELMIKEVEAREMPKDIEEGVQVYWNELIAKYPGMFNGPLYSAINMENEDGMVTLTCEPSDYAHYKYSEIKDLGEYACRSMYAGCILVSSDKKLFVSLNGIGSEFVGKIQGIGGVIEPSDRIIGGSIREDGSIEKDKLSPLVTALRELEEEVGKVIRDSVTDIGKSYLVTNDNKFGFPFVFYSSLDSEGIYRAFDSFKKETGSNEVARLVSFGKDDMEELKKYEQFQDIGIVDLLKIIMREL